MNNINNIGHEWLTPLSTKMLGGLLRYTGYVAADMGANLSTELEREVLRKGSGGKNQSM